MDNVIRQDSSDKKVTLIKHCSVIFSALAIAYLIGLFAGFITPLTILVLPFLIPIALVTSLILGVLFHIRDIPLKSDWLAGYLFVITFTIGNIANLPKPDGGVMYSSNYVPPLLGFYLLGTPNEYAGHLATAAGLALAYIIIGLGYIAIRRKVGSWLVIVPGILLLLYEIF